MTPAVALAEAFAAYRVMPKVELLSVQSVVIRPGWLDRRRVRVACQLCREGVNYGLVVMSDGLTLSRSCAAAGYYVSRTLAPETTPTTAI